MGTERRRSDSLAEPPGTILLPFRGASVYTVVAPGPDSEALPPAPVRIRLELDGRDLDPGHFGDDAFLEGGRPYMRVDTPRLYHVARGLGPSEHTLRFFPDEAGLTIYAFSFGACLAAPAPSLVPLQEAPPC